MSKKIKRKILKAVKKGVAKQISKEVKKMVEKKGSIKDAALLDFIKKYTQYLALQAMGEKVAKKNVPKPKKLFSPLSKTSFTSSKIEKDFKFNIRGMDKVAKDVMNGKDTGKAIKDNAKISVSFSLKW